MPEIKYINASEAFEIWQYEGLPGTYPTFLSLIKKQDFVLLPASRVVLVKEEEFKKFIFHHKLKEKNSDAT